MAEYIERGTFIEAVKDIPMWGSVAAMIADSIPTADVAPVVRCRDCMHLRPEVDAYTQETVGYWCAELDIGSVDVDGFCNRGERKETDHE